MAVKPIAADSKLVVYNNEVDLADKGVSQVYQGATIAEIVAASGGGGGGGATLVTTVPTFDATKIDERVYFNGEEWIYASQDWINALGLNGIITPGYAVPVNANSNYRRVTDLSGGLFGVGNSPSGIDQPLVKATDVLADLGSSPAITWDFRHMDPWGPRASTTSGYPVGAPGYKLAFADYTNASGTPTQTFEINKFEGVEYLHTIRDAGTALAFAVDLITATNTPITCSSATIDDFFARLPVRNPNTNATIDITGFSGSAGANASIAQGRGYIVIQ